MEKHPQWQSSSSCLVRNEERANLVRAHYPHVRLVSGDLADADLLEDEAAQADIVIHCASIEDPISSQALANGLSRRKRPGTAFWICLSGTDNLAWKTIEDDSYGQSSDLVYDDFDHISTVMSLPHSAPHRDVEKIQLEAAREDIKVAIVCAPCVYGAGHGVGSTRSIQLPDLAQHVIEHGTAFKVDQGLNRWPNIHVHDLSSLIRLLAEEALRGGGSATWGQKEGYYFAENGEHCWGDIADLVATAARDSDLVPDAKVVSWSAKEADVHVPFGALFWGTDSRCKAVRARKILDWQPKAHSMEDEVSKTLANEARRMER
jgi:nucleoside-diphosphate-sugar epimerase